MNGINSKDRFSFAKGYRARTIFLIFDILLLGILMCMMVLPLLKVLDWDGDKAWRKRLMAAVRTQAAFYPHFLEPRLAPGEELTPTELQILHLLCADKSNAEIARIMDVKLPTVKTHVSHILDKLDVKRRAEARTAAKKLRLIPDDL